MRVVDAFESGLLRHVTWCDEPVQGEPALVEGADGQWFVQMYFARPGTDPTAYTRLLLRTDARIHIEVAPGDPDVLRPLTFSDPKEDKQ